MPRLFGAQHWAWRGAVSGYGMTDVSRPDKAELAPGVQMESMFFFFSTASCPSHPWLRGNAFLLFAAPRVYIPQTVPSSAPPVLLGPSTISCSCRGLQWTLFAALLLQAIRPSCFRMKESLCRDDSFLQLMVKRAEVGQLIFDP